MAYDLDLADRIREVVAGEPGVTESLVGDPHVRRFAMRGREMDGWLHIDTEGLDTDEAPRRWVSRGVTYARSLPRKQRL